MGGWWTDFVWLWGAGDGLDYLLYTLAKKLKITTQYYPSCFCAVSHRDGLSLPDPILVEGQGINEGHTPLTFNPMATAINLSTPGNSVLPNSEFLCSKGPIMSLRLSLLLSGVFGLVQYQPPNEGKLWAPLLKEEGHVIPLSTDLGRDRHHLLTRADNVNVSFHSSVLTFLVILSSYELPLNVKKKKKSPEK